MAGLGRERKSKSPISYFSFSRKIKKWKLAQKKIEKVFFPVGKIQENEFIFSAAYFKVVISLLNLNQRENLILKMDMFLIDYNIVIILTNVD